VRVLFLHSGTEDYLAQALFHGLRELLGAGCVDVPRFDVMYRDLPADRRATLRGHGFTLYTLLPDLPELAPTRARWADEIGGYDLVVIANVWRQWEQLRDPAVRAAWRRVVLVDGDDGTAVYPYAAWLLRRSPRAVLSGARDRPYYKREWVGGGTEYGVFARRLPASLRRRLPHPRRVRPIAFAVPAEKVADFGTLVKTKEFPRHLVDPDLAAGAGGFYSAVGSDRYVFETETDYYADLRASRFGVTTRRAGWDCLRHYELAANGCVLCFRDLDAKPPTCAPHGLTAANCIPYRSAAELAGRVKALSAGEYQDLLGATRAWVEENTTVAATRRFLATAPYP
jgi:hypothetical protein